MKSKGFAGLVLLLGLAVVLDSSAREPQKSPPPSPVIISKTVRARDLGIPLDPLDARGRLTSADHVAQADESLGAPLARQPLGGLQRAQISVDVRDEGPAGHSSGTGRARGRSCNRTGCGVRRDGIQTRALNAVQPRARSSRMMRSLSWEAT